MTRERNMGVYLPTVDAGKDNLVTDQFREARKTFLGLAQKPQDQRLGAFYQAVYDLSDPQGDHPHFAQFFDISVGVMDNRGLSMSLFSNLFYRAFQYDQIFRQGRTEYDDSFLEPNAWREILVGESGLITNDGKITEHGKSLYEILNTRETTTTIYQRYAGPKAVLNALMPDQDVKVADFGCGAHYGLKGFVKDEPFDSITVDLVDLDSDVSEHRATIHRLITSPINISEGLGVDKNPLDGEDEFRWRLACSFYPGELSAEGMQRLLEREKAMTNVPGVDFLQGDLLELEHNHRDGTLPIAHYDAVIAATMLYQMTPEEQKILIDSAMESLKDDRYLIVQDFAKIDPHDHSILRFTNNWGEPFSYRTLILQKGTNQWQEFLQWGNGRCKVVRPGADFDAINTSHNIAHVDFTATPVPVTEVFNVGQIA